MVAAWSTALALYFTPRHSLPPFNKAGLLAWVHTCHFYLHVAGWVEHIPHLSLHSVPSGACASLVGSSVTLHGVSLSPLLHYSLLGCVAANLLACTLQGVLVPLPFYDRVHPTTCSPIYTVLPNIVFSLVVMVYVK